MGTAIHLGLSGAWFSVLLLCSACAGAGAEGTPPPPSADNAQAQSVCAECPVEAGGESSDFGGTPHPCIHFEQPTEIERDRAIELGFDLDRLEPRIERPIDASLRWKPSEPRGGGPAAGYQPETWIEGTTRLSGRITYVALDPARCDGTACADPEYGELTCSDRLDLGIEGEFRTLDGAVSAYLAGYLLYGRSGSDWYETPASSLRANLRDVHGTLRVFPDPNLTITEALLRMDLFFTNDRTDGDLRPSLILRDSPTTAVSYLPLSGHWPGTPLEPREPPMGGSEP